MAKSPVKKKSILTDKSFEFFKGYINNASPVGFETSGQKLWLEYIKPNVESFYTDLMALLLELSIPMKNLK